jgi:hypothetical protein
MSLSSRSLTDDWADSDDIVPREPREGNYGYAAHRSLTSDLVLGDLSLHPEYERARSKFGVDLMSLSILTNFNVGKSTIAILSADPTRLASLLNLHQWSYLEYVPQRYGVSECLTAATNCLLAKVHTVLAPREDSSSVCTRLYGKALRALQDALANDSSAMDADVLCATQLLSLHEVCGPHFDLQAKTNQRHSYSIQLETQHGRIMSRDRLVWFDTAPPPASSQTSSVPCSQLMSEALLASVS